MTLNAMRSQFRIRIRMSQIVGTAHFFVCVSLSQIIFFFRTHNTHQNRIFFFLYAYRLQFSIWLCRIVELTTDYFMVI